MTLWWSNLRVMGQRDVDTPSLPGLVTILYELQISMTSVNWKRDLDKLHVHPQPDADLTDKIRAAFDELRYLLPGYCDGCLEWSIKRQEMYWGAHPHLCFKCQHSVIVQLDSGRVEWPEPHFPDSL